jgi:hypothetical protein
MRINQVEALADFMEALQSACVENGVTVTGSVMVEISDGNGGAGRAIVWQQPDPKEDDPDDWHIEGTFLDHG